MIIQLVMYFTLYIKILEVLHYITTTAELSILFNRFALQRFIICRLLNPQKMHIMDILEHGECSVLLFPHTYHNINENLRILNIFFQFRQST